LWDVSKRENETKWLKIAGAAHLIAFTTALTGYFGAGVAAYAGATPLTVTLVGGGSAGIGGELGQRLLGKPYSSWDYLKAILEGAGTGLVFHGLGQLFKPKALVIPNEPYIPQHELPTQNVRGQDIPIPDPKAEGAAHTTLGGRTGTTDGVRYRQSATFSRAKRGHLPKARRSPGAESTGTTTAVQRSTRILTSTSSNSTGST